MARRLLFAVTLLAAAYVREGSGVAVDQAVIWLPSGVAVAGLWLLGPRDWWVVAVCTVAQRLLLGYDPGVAVSAAAGSVAEGLAGALLLSRLGLDAGFSRMRDLLALFAAAAAAPLASIAASMLGRAFVWADPAMPFYSGWDGWWRMNALGILTTVPAAATWLGPRARRLVGQEVAVAVLATVATAGAVVGLVGLVPVSVTGVLLLVAVIPVSLWAGLQFGPRGAASAGTVAALVVILTTIHGAGPFLAVPPAERHQAIQVFELFLVGAPLVLGVLVAERKRAEAEIRRLADELEARVVARTAELTEANRELEAFSYSVSHELRTPLRAIDGHVAMLAEELGPGLDAEPRRHVGALRWNAQRMGRLVDDLLAFAHAGRVALSPAPVDMARAAGDALARLVPDPDHRARIALVLGDLPPAHGDPRLLRRVWETLLGNAVKFSSGRERPEVHVEGTVIGSEVVYRVTDNGVGFDPRFRDKLFGVFHRLHAVHEFEGSGVGLALARRIVLRHGGRVWAEGELDRGASFSFALPRREPAASGT